MRARIEGFFIAALSIAFVGCQTAPLSSHQSAIPVTSPLEQTSNSINIINWGNYFADFWSKAKGAPFDKQVSLWNSIVEAPHKKFYDDVVWRVNAPDSSERKSKRLREIFKEYGRRNSDIAAAFKDFSNILGSQIQKFKITFPSAKLLITVMAVPAPTFNGKTDSYEDNGHKHFLAFGIDTLTIRNDDPSVLYSHELFHVFHDEASGIKDDGAGNGATLLDSLWAEGLATYVSKEMNPAAPMKSVFMDDSLAMTDEILLPEMAREFLKVRDIAVHSKDQPEMYGLWFLMNKRPNADLPSRSGYFLGYHVAKSLRRQHRLDEMTHWSFAEAKTQIVNVLETFASKAPQDER